MRTPVRVTVGVALLLATLVPSAAASAQEAPPLPDSIAAVGDSITQAVDVCCFYGNWPRHSWSTGYASSDGIASHYERILARNPAIRGRRYNNAVSGARMADAPGDRADTFDERSGALHSGAADDGGERDRLPVGSPGGIGDLPQLGERDLPLAAAARRIEEDQDRLALADAAEHEPPPRLVPVPRRVDELHALEMRIAR